jgi:hypothetical protein
MKNIEGLKLTKNQLRGYYAIFPNEKTPIFFDIEESKPSFDDFTGIVEFANKTLANLSETTFTKIRKEVAKELTSAAYSQASYSPTSEDELNLEIQLYLRRISFYPNNIISMVFEAKNEYPDMLIYCQLNEDFEIEDVIVE